MSQINYNVTLQLNPTIEVNKGHSRVLQEPLNNFDADAPMQYYIALHSPEQTAIEGHVASTDVEELLDFVGADSVLAAYASYWATGNGVTIYIMNLTKAEAQQIDAPPSTWAYALVLPNDEGPASNEWIVAIKFDDPAADMEITEGCVI